MIEMLAGAGIMVVGVMVGISIERSMYEPEETDEPA